MSIEKSLLNKTQLKREYKITVPVEVVESAVDAKALSLQKSYKANGFRAGKVPVNVIKKREEGGLFMSCAEDKINSTIEEIVKDENLDLVLRPDVKIEVFEEKKDIEFTVVFELKPDMPDIKLKDIKLDSYNIIVEDKDMEDSIERILKAQKNWKEQEKKAALGDMVKINFVGRVDGVEFEGGKANDYQLELGSKSFIDNFEEQLVNSQKGDKVLVNVTFPKDYHKSSLAGKKAEFDVEVLSVMVAEAAVLSDEFVKNNFNLDNVDKFRELVKTELEKTNARLAKTYLKTQLFKKLDEMLKFEVPEGLVAEQEKKLWYGVEEEMSRNPDKFKDEKELEKAKAENKKEAEKMIRIGLFVSETGKTMNIELTETEVSQAIFQRAMSMPGYEKIFIDYYKNNPEALDALRGALLEDKVVEKMLEEISCNSKDITIDDFQKLSK